VKASRLLAFSGLFFAANGEREPAVVKNVAPDSPAWRAGITYGDEIVAVNAARVNGATVGKRLADGKPGQEIVVSYFRRDRLRTAKLRLVRNPERKWSFTVDTTASRQAKHLRTRWLGATG
jgi:predicted metalloprotease with PDZ domain